MAVCVCKKAQKIKYLSKSFEDSVCSSAVKSNIGHVKWKNKNIIITQAATCYNAQSSALLHVQLRIQQLFYTSQQRVLASSPS